MAEFDDDEVTGNERLGQRVEAVLICIGARRPAGYGIVDDRDSQGVGKIDAPALEQVSLER